jgi:hypothetical protein
MSILAYYLTYFNSAKISSSNQTCRKMHGISALLRHIRFRLSTPDYLLTKRPTQILLIVVTAKTTSCPLISTYKPNMIAGFATRLLRRRRSRRKSCGISPGVYSYSNKRLSRGSNYILSARTKKKYNNNNSKLPLTTHLHLQMTPLWIYSIC